MRITKQRLIFAIGTILIIISSAGFFDSNRLSNQLASLNRKIESDNSNFIQMIRNEERVQSFRDVRTIILEINRSSDVIQELDNAQKVSFATAIKIKYNAIYDKPITIELWNYWLSLSLKELEDLSNKYSQEFMFSHYNQHIAERNSLEDVLNSRIVIYVILNTVGLFLVFIADMMKNDIRTKEESF